MPDNADPTASAFSNDQTVESTFAADPQASNAGVGSSSEATDITHDPGGRVNHVLITNPDGSLHEVEPAAGDVQPPA